MQPTYEELFTQIKVLTQQNKVLTQQLQEALTEIKTLKVKVKELEEKLNTNSSNSSKAPSQDPFRSRRPKKSTGRRRGAQKGHPGHSRTLVPIEHVQTQLHLRPQICPSCQSNDFDVEAVRTEIRQVVELPEIPPGRSSAAFQEVFGLFKGGLTTDRHGAYNSHEGSRQLCWSHADRDFEKIASRDGFDKLVGEQLLQCKSTVFDLWHRFKAGQIQRDELISRIEAGPKEDMRLWLKAGVAYEDGKRIWAPRAIERWHIRGQNELF